MLATKAIHCLVF